MNKPAVFRYQIKSKRPSDLGEWRTSSNVMAKSEALAVEVFKAYWEKFTDVIVSIKRDAEIDMETAHREIFGKAERSFLPEYFA